MLMSNYELALEVIAGKWGNGPERKQRLTEAGHNYDAVQSIVNSILANGGNTAPAQPAEPDQDILTIDYDPEKYKGIQVNVLV